MDQAKSKKFLANRTQRQERKSYSPKKSNSNMALVRAGLRQNPVIQKNRQKGQTQLGRKSRATSLRAMHSHMEKQARVSNNPQNFQAEVPRR